MMELLRILGVAALMLLAVAILVRANELMTSQRQRLPKRRPSDPVINLDQWTEERRQRLTDLHRPAAKFIDARRKR